MKRRSTIKKKVVEVARPPLRSRKDRRADAREAGAHIAKAYLEGPPPPGCHRRNGVTLAGRNWGEADGQLNRSPI